MPHDWTIRRFLVRQHGYYCEDCLARTLGLSTEDVRRNAPRSATGDVVTRYRICHGCMTEKEVVGVRLSA
jgi:hypothetical protein